MKGGAKPEQSLKMLAGKVRDYFLLCTNHGFFHQRCSIRFTSFTSVSSCHLNSILDN